MLLSIGKVTLEMSVALELSCGNEAVPVLNTMDTANSPPDGDLMCLPVTHRRIQRKKQKCFGPLRVR